MKITLYPISRRLFLSLGGLLGLSEMVRANTRGRWAEALVARASALNGPGLIQSYEVSGRDAFAHTQEGCAYVYDNAVAGLALIALGRPDLAAYIGEALAIAQSRDRFWRDGRLRNAYFSGPAPRRTPYPLPGWWDEGRGSWAEDAYQVGTATGVLAWAILLWIWLGPKYRLNAEKAAQWILDRLHHPRGFLGGFIGFEPTPQRVGWLSTEHHVDLYAVFNALGETAAANRALEFVSQMWVKEDGRFATGLKPDGSINMHSAVDANLWPLLVKGAQPSWSKAFDWVVSKHGLPQNSLLDEIEGVDFNTDRDGIWLEGTAITLLVAKNQKRQVDGFERTLHDQTATSGFIYACTTPSITTGLSTGVDDTSASFRYFRYPHLAPTAWAVLAEKQVNPFLYP